MAKILKEREEAAAAKRDPTFVDPDAEARARLKALQVRKRVRGAVGSHAHVTHL